ncbi:MAG: prefoldin subunit alpha [DPANN group archaeon]|nr:prefoldin subunit alpha [DPANN group archaeon]
MAETKKDIQQEYAKLQMLDEQIKMLQKQLETYEAQLVEIMNMKTAIEEFSKVRPGTEMLVPIGPGIFVKGSVMDTKNLTISVGAGTAVSKTLDEGKGLLDLQARDVEQARMTVLKETERIIEQARKIEKEILSA